jgi:hypothetical protein
MSAVLIAGAKVKHHAFPAATRQVSLRNTGTNTLWLSLDDGESWFDVACGTSLDDRVSLSKFCYCTQVGRTRFVVIALALVDVDVQLLERSEEPSRRTPKRTRQPRRRWLPSRLAVSRR